MKNLTYSIFLFLLFLTVSSCGQKEESDIPEANDYIKAYTTGVVSRTELPRVRFQEEIPEANTTPEKLSKSFQILPKTEGEWKLLEDRYVIFKPTQGLKSGTEYTVKVDLERLFGLENSTDKFKFRFRTIDLQASYRFNSMAVDINEMNDTIYEMRGSILTSDWEDSTTIRNMIGFSKPVDLRWEEEKFAKRFDFRLTMKDAPQQQETIEVFLKSNSKGYPKGSLGEIRVPASKEFTVYAIETAVRDDQEDHFRVTFTRSLDPNQDFTGLVDVEGNDATFQVAGNTLKIWIKDKSRPERTIRIHNGIRSYFGNKLDVTKVSDKSKFSKRVSLSSDDPDLGFIGEGGIIPVSGDAIIPFHATNLNGVIVRIVKIYENNMGDFLQVNNLDGDNQLARMGVLLCRKLIFLDEFGHYDLHKKNTFALNLKDLIAVEPGAMYRVILSYNFELSAFPCPDRPVLSKRALREKNLELEKQEKAAFGNGNSYYYFSDQDWNGYKWQERNMPCKYSYYMNRQIAKNVLSSDIGVIGKQGEQGKLFISVHNISSADPIPGAKVTIYDFQNQIIDSRETWENGSAEINTKGGIPFYVIAEKEGQKGYLRMDPAESLSMSTFDVSGQEVQKGIKGFIYTDRGVWRPGDTIFIGFILEAKAINFPQKHPVTFELYNPSGQLYSRNVITRSINNFYTYPAVTTPDAPTGSWRLKVTVGGASFEKRLRIESIKPNRLSIALQFDNPVLVRGKREEATLRSAWLTGATAGNLKFDISGTFVEMKSVFKGFESYIFDDPTRSFSSEDVLFAKGKTDAAGVAKVGNVLHLGAMAPGMLKAQFLTKVYEESGEFSVDAVQVPYSPFTSYVGIKQDKNDESPLPTGKNQTFEIATVSDEGKAIAQKEISVRLFKLEWYWWWSSNMSNVANFVSSGYNKPVKEFTVSTDAAGKGNFVLNIPQEDWGSYYIQVRDVASEHQSGRMVYFDSYFEEHAPSADRDKANLLTISTDKERYKPGEEIRVSFPSTEKSKALLTVETGEGVIAHYRINCEKGETVFKFKATKEMQPNAYLGITLLNPYASTANDLPIRLYGVVPVLVNSPDSRLEPVIGSAAVLKPDQSFTLEISEKNGQPMTYTLAVVDEGLLDLTHFKTPSPWEAFNAKEALGVRTWDMYKYVLGAYGGKIEQLFSIGGDDALNKGPKAIVNRFKPVVIFKGPLVLKKNETQKIQLRMPNYVGKVRCMLIAGNENGFGNAQREIPVKQPVMVLGTLPRALAPDDEVMLPVTVFAMEENIGDVEVSVNTSDLLKVVGSNKRTVHFNKSGDQTIWFPVRVKNQVGVAEVKLTAQGRGVTSVWESEIEVSSPLRSVTKSSSYLIEKGESKRIPLNPFGLPDTRKTSVEVSSLAPLDIQRRANELRSYPYDCLEQLVSKTFAFLYLPSMMQYSGSELQEIKKDLQHNLGRLRDYIMPDGSFAYWPGGTSSNGWASVYATSFMVSAAAQGYVLPSGIEERALKYQGRLAREWQGIESPVLASEEMTQAYRLYLLAIAGMPEKGAMNRLLERKNLNSSAKWMLANAYIYLGRPQTALRIVENISPGDDRNNDETSIYTYGSDLRNKSIRLIALINLKRMKEAYPLAQQIIKELNSDSWLSTQSTSFGLMAMYVYFREVPPADHMSFILEKKEQKEEIETGKGFWSAPVNSNLKEIVITNRGKGTLYVKTNEVGVPSVQNQIAVNNGIEIKQQFENMDGSVVDVKNLTLGSNFRMVTRVTNVSSVGVRDLMLSQRVAGGWEILNNRYMFNTSLKGNSIEGTSGNSVNGEDSSASSGTSGLQPSTGITYQDFRDNEVLSYIPYLSSGTYVTSIINLVAAYGGVYFLPASQCDAMYQGSINASTAGEKVKVVILE